MLVGDRIGAVQEVGCCSSREHPSECPLRPALWGREVGTEIGKSQPSDQDLPQLQRDAWYPVCPSRSSLDLVMERRRRVEALSFSPK